MLHNSPSALELAQVYCSFVLFFSRSLDCISCSGKEMCDTPIGTTSWSPAVKRNGWRSWCNVGTEGGNVTICKTQNMFHRMRSTNFSGILRYKQITYLGQTTKPSDKKKQKKEQTRTCRIVNVTVPADHRVKIIKESKKRNKYQDLARELKKLWNIKLTVIPIVVGARGQSSKDW